MSSRPSPPRRTTRDAGVSVDAGLPRDRRIAALVTRLDRARRAQSNQMDLGTADLRILWMFSDDKPRTLKEIAAELGLEQSTVNRQINSAMAAGLLQRSRRPGSAAHEISPTPEGIRAFEADVEKSLAAFGAGLEALGERADEFLADLTQFVSAYDRTVRPDSDES
ncbi:MAG: MarR family winged helix-turn-helix transcriptional regulator [Brevibacterium sp.]